MKIGGKTRFENLLKHLFHLPLLDMKQEITLIISWYHLDNLLIWSDYNQLALRARWLFYHFISNSGSWNNCYISRASGLGLPARCGLVTPLQRWEKPENTSTNFVPRFFSTSQYGRAFGAAHLENCRGDDPGDEDDTSTCLSRTSPLTNCRF